MFYRIKIFFTDLRCWFRHCFNKRKLNTIKTVTNAYPFDYAYKYEIDKAWFKEQLAYFEKTKIIDATNIVRRIKLALSLLDIITEERTLVTVTRTFKYEYDPVEDLPYNFDTKLNVYVNTRNAKRFIRNWDSIPSAVADKPIMQAELYREKAYKLYYRLMEQYSREWWD